MAMSVGRGWIYYIISITITVVLALAANTSFGGLPVLASLVARDNYLPHLFTIRGDRQTFGNGIFVLTIMAGALLIAVDGNTNTLIPLFAIGVFIGFTLSQAGLVVHWWRERPARWRRRAAINGFGAVITAIATIVFLVSKFTEGAWVVVIAIPAFIWLFLRIHAYYERSAKELRFDENPGLPEPKRTIVVVPVNRISRLTEHALSEAESLGQEVIAVTVILEGADEGAAAKVRAFLRPLGPVELRHTAQGAAHRVRLRRAADRGLHRRAARRPPRRPARCPDPHCATVEAALPDPPQPDRPGALRRAAKPGRRRGGPGHGAAGEAAARGRSRAQRRAQGRARGRQPESQSGPGTGKT